MSAAGILQANDIRMLKEQLSRANAKIATLTKEKDERDLRERVFMTLGTVPGAWYTLSDMERAVRYIMDGKTS